MTDATDIRDAMVTSAQGPKRTAADGVSAEEHDIEDQIMAEQHVAGQSAAALPRRGMRFTNLIPAGPS